MSQKVISFHYTLTNPAGEVLDSSAGREPLAFLTGSEQIIPGLEKQLVGMNKGDKQTVKVPAAEAYGEHNPEMVGDVERSRFPADVSVGQMYATDPQGLSAIKVVAVTDTTVTVDGNHPLAGQELTFAVEITDLRDATAEEVAHGHVHDGHHHH